MAEKLWGWTKVHGWLCVFRRFRLDAYHSAVPSVDSEELSRSQYEINPSCVPSPLPRDITPASLPSISNCIKNLFSPRTFSKTCKQYYLFPFKGIPWPDLLYQLQLCFSSHFCSTTPLELSMFAVSSSFPLFFSQIEPDLTFAPTTTPTWPLAGPSITSMWPNPAVNSEPSSWLNSQQPHSQSPLFCVTLSFLGSQDTTLCCCSSFTLFTPSQLFSASYPSSHHLWVSAVLGLNSLPSCLPLFYPVFKYHPQVSGFPVYFSSLDLSLLLKKSISCCLLDIPTRMLY